MCVCVRVCVCELLWVPIKTVTNPNRYGVLLTWYTFYGWAALFWATATNNIAKSVSIWDTAPGEGGLTLPDITPTLAATARIHICAAGLILMAVRVLVFGFFVWAQNTTVRQYQQKKVID